MDPWRFGLFYYDPADPRLMVPKLRGLGWTFNFGNPWSWVALLLILVLIVVLSLRKRRQE